ncbi:MAG: hypothetical protein LAO78_26450, partial [Acidobacteriia bacterium]|nr:hypothetical protein [Terriglobia bacterium]
ASDSFRMPMICSSLNRLFLTSPPPPWRAILMEKSHSVWTISGGAGHDRNSISLENLSDALIGHPTQFPNYPHAQSLFSKLENFTATAVCLLFYLPARHLSSSRRLWFTCITQFSSSGLGIEKLATAFTAGERP